MVSLGRRECPFNRKAQTNKLFKSEEEEKKKEKKDGRSLIIIIHLAKEKRRRSWIGARRRCRTAVKGRKATVSVCLSVCVYFGVYLGGRLRRSYMHPSWYFGRPDIRPFYNMGHHHRLIPSDRCSRTALPARPSVLMQPLTAIYTHINIFMSPALYEAKP